MPFTPAHVMAVLPGVHWHRRLHLDPTCLVIGSMAPDFEYFLRGDQRGYFSHTFVGIFAWGIPVTLLLAALYHHVVKWPALLAAPAAVTPVFARPWHERWTIGAIASVVGSAVLGDVTHILWDGITHANGIIVARVPFLRTPYDVPILGTMALYRILQHASTLVGLFGVTWFVVHQIRRAPARPTIDVRRAMTRWIFAGCMVVGASLTLGRILVFRRWVDDLGNFVVAIISGLLAGIIVASLIVRAAARTYREAFTA